MNPDNYDLTETPELSAREKVLDRRRRILDTIRDAAIEEFATSGFIGASTQAIAQRAGLTKPQLHYYISSKEELYEEILFSILDEWKDIFFGASASKEPAKVIREYIRRKLQYSQKNPRASRVFTTEIANGAPFLGKHWAQYQLATHDAVKLIQTWIDDGLIRPIDPLLFQIHIWAVTQHYADFDLQIRYMMSLRDGDELNTAHIEEEVCNLFLRFCGLE